MNFTILERYAHESLTYRALGMVKVRLNYLQQALIRSQHRMCFTMWNSIFDGKKTLLAKIFHLFSHKITDNWTRDTTREQIFVSDCKMKILSISDMCSVCCAIEQMPVVSFFSTSGYRMGGNCYDGRSKK